MAQNGCKVLCYGGIAVESVIELPYQPKPGIAHIICQEHYRLGGGAANVAEWLGSWEIPTRLSGNIIGYDHYGDLLWKWLNDYSAIDLHYLERKNEISSLIARSVPFPDGNRYLLCSDFAQADFAPPTPAMLAGAQILEIAFYYRNPRGNAAAAELATMAHTKGIEIVAMDVVSAAHETLPMADIVINSAASIVEKFPDVNILEHSVDLQRISRGIVITTDGDRPVHAIDRDGTHYSLQPPKVPVTETTGAGDSFRAGIIYARLQQWPLPRSMKWAAAVATQQVQRSFSQDQPPAKQKIANLVKLIEVQRTG